MLLKKRSGLANDRRAYSYFRTPQRISYNNTSSACGCPAIAELQQQVTYLTNIIQTLIDASGNYAQLNTENEFTEPNIFTTLSLTQYIPHYALNNNLRNFMNNQSVDFYGDSITNGDKLPSPSTQNWAYRLCQKFTNCTCVNNAVNGSVPYDFFFAGSSSMGTKAVQASHVSGRTTFLDFGTNVLQRITSYATSQPNSGQIDGAITGHVNTMESMIMFCTLPDSQKFNARNNVNVTRVGNWTNTPEVGGNYSIGSVTANDTITCINLNGRYVGVSFLVNYELVNTAGFVLTLDGVDYSTSLSLITTMNSTRTTNNTKYQIQDIIIDTGVSTNHTILIKNLNNTPKILYVNYFYFFNQNDSNCNPVFVMEQEVANYTATAYVNATSNNGSITRAMTWFLAMRRLVYRLRVYYGLPIYYIDNTFANILSLGCADTIHPNALWHQQMADRAYNFLTNGELAYPLL